MTADNNHFVRRVHPAQHPDDNEFDVLKALFGISDDTIVYTHSFTPSRRRRLARRVWDLLDAVVDTINASLNDIKRTDT